MELQGTIHEIQPLQTFESGFQKQTFILATNDEYVQYIPIDFTRDKVSVLDNYKVGDKVSVSINLNGNKWQKTPQDPIRYFLSATAWKMNGLNEPNNATQSAQPKPNVDPFSDSEDLPF